MDNSIKLQFDLGLYPTFQKLTSIWLLYKLFIDSKE